VKQLPDVGEPTDNHHEHGGADCGQDKPVDRLPGKSGCGHGSSGNDEALLQPAINFTAALLKKEIPTLVCCGAGMSRAPAIAAAALATLGGGTLDDCMQKVAQYHKTDVSPGFWSELQKVFVSGA
jgi:hypothetical protein